MLAFSCRVQTVFGVKGRSVFSSWVEAVCALLFTFTSSSWKSSSYLEKLQPSFTVDCGLHRTSKLLLNVTCHPVAPLCTLTLSSCSQLLYATHKRCNRVVLITAGENPTFLDFGASFPRFY